MKIAEAKVVKVSGKCNAGYKIGDSIFIDRDKSLINKNESDNLCIWALISIASNMCRVDENESILTSCPDPGTGRGGNVVFKVETTETL